MARTRYASNPDVHTAPASCRTARCSPSRISRRRRRLLLLLSLVGPAIGISAPLAPTARAEIGELMSRLGASGCEFNRNGAWYTAAEAKSHLSMKLKYLEDRGAVSTTEQFIEMAASTSSVTGRPYLVKCGSDAPVSSREWLLFQLRAIRSSRTPS